MSSAPVPDSSPGDCTNDSEGNNVRKLTVPRLTVSYRPLPPKTSAPRPHTPRPAVPPDLAGARVLPHVERDGDARAPPTERDVGRAVFEKDPAAVGAPPGDIISPALAKLSVHDRDARVERLLRLVLGCARRRIALGPEPLQELPLAGERKAWIDPPLLRAHQVHQRSVHVVELGLGGAREGVGSGRGVHLCPARWRDEKRGEDQRRPTGDHVMRRNTKPRGWFPR